MGIPLGLISQVFGFDSRSRIQFNIMSEDELKPCPFCGGKPIGPELDGFSTYTEYWIDCEACEIVMARRGESELIKSWNTRASEYHAKKTKR